MLINLAEVIPKTSWWSCLRQMVVVQCNLGQWISVKVILGYLRSCACVVFAHNFLQKQGRAMGIPHCVSWSRRIDWYAYWPCLVTIWSQGHVIWGHLMSKFDLDLPGLTNKSSDAFRRQKHNYFTLSTLRFFVYLFSRKTLLFECVDLTSEVNIWKKV